VNRFIVKSLPVIAAIGLPLTASAHEADFEHGHILPGQQPAATSTSSYASTSQPGVIDPVYGGQFAKENHRFVITSNVETSVETAISDLNAEERALKKRDYEKNTKWIDGWRDAYKDDIRDLKQMEKRLEAMQKVQMDDAVEGYSGKPSQWKVGLYDTPYINRGKWLTLDDLKEYFRPKSRGANGLARAKVPKVEGPKKKKKGLGSILKKVDPRNW